VLDWRSLNEPAERKRLALVQELLAVRRQEIVPRLAKAAFGEAHAADNGMLTASWRLGDGARLELRANLSNREITDKPGETSGIPIWGGAPGEVMMPWSVIWRLEMR
jgi:maltooligosyltrehalose trehalohydrolase